MRKLSVWYVVLITCILGFTSCEQTEDFDNNDSEVEILVDHKEGSAVYRFEAKTNGVNDAELIWSIDGNIIDGENQNDIINQILDYLFEPGKHTICVKVISEDITREACIDIEVTIDENNPCPDLFFKSKQYERPYTYKFYADFRGVENTPYQWLINGELVEDSAPNEDNYLIWDFKESGTYEVCIMTETSDCPEGASYCKEIIVKESDLVCPEVSFEKGMEPGSVNTYVFEANIKGAKLSEVNEVTEIKWYINDDLIENPSDPQEGNRVLRYQFEDGVYTICLKVITPDCPEGVKYCKEIRVGEFACPELSFEIEQQGNSNGYKFFPGNFEGVQDVSSEWFVDGEYVGSSSGKEDPFAYDFEPGSYEVCLLVETPQCPEGVKKCEMLEVIDPTN